MVPELLVTRSIDRIFETVFALPAVESFARSGSYLLRLIFSSRQLADEFLPSFLRDDIGKPDLQLGFLTSAEVDLFHLIPDPPNEYRAIASEACFAMWQPADQSMLYLLDRKSKRAVIWLATGTAPDWIASRPALPIMSAFSLNTDWIALHAAAVSRGGRTLLLAGDQRAGKTTAALSCAQAGWDYAGDDYVFVNSGNAKVEPLYRSARLRSDVASAFAKLLREPTRMSSSDGEPRYEIRLGGADGRNRIKGGSLVALLLPRRRGAIKPEFTAARRIDAVSGFKASISLAMSYFHRDMRQLTTNKIIKTVALAPVFFVDTGKCPADIPIAFEEFLGRL